MNMVVSTSLQVGFTVMIASEIVFAEINAEANDDEDDGGEVCGHDLSYDPFS